jgi:predicted 3-demethylubiquinone-9 3-methyltransferase (glyoxalase superfamily)
MESTTQRISPCLWFNDQAEDAASFYTLIFSNSRILRVMRYDGDASQASGRPKGSVMTVTFQLEGQEFVALNGGPHFKLTEAVSFIVRCGSQEEVDYYWEKLSEGGNEKAQQCGWLKDQFGLSWQVVPSLLYELLNDPDAERSHRVMKAMLQMKKIDIQALLRAYDGIGTG